MESRPGKRTLPTPRVEGVRPPAPSLAPSVRTNAMPRQRIYYRRSTYELPADFPERLKRFQEESGLSCSEIACRLGTYRHGVALG